MTTRAHSPHLVYVDRSNGMKTGVNAATVSQVPCRKSTGKGFIMRHTHELRALHDFFTFLGEQRQVRTKREWNACMRNGGQRDAEGKLD